jgi:hypothetical protein
MTMEEIMEMDPFVFVNHSRNICAESEKFQNFVSSTIYPVTISEKVFLSYYDSSIKEK